MCNTINYGHWINTKHSRINMQTVSYIKHERDEPQRIKLIFINGLNVTIMKDDEPEFFSKLEEYIFVSKF